MPASQLSSFNTQCIFSDTPMCYKARTYDIKSRPYSTSCTCTFQWSTIHPTRLVNIRITFRSLLRVVPSGFSILISDETVFSVFAKMSPISGTVAPKPMKAMQYAVRSHWFGCFLRLVKKHRLVILVISFLTTLLHPSSFLIDAFRTSVIKLENVPALRLVSGWAPATLDFLISS